MKRALAIFILSTYASVILFGIGSIVSAQSPLANDTAVEKEKNLQKVYYSESLGVDKETKVYQVTSCKRVRSQAPLRCSLSNWDTFKKQCTDQKGNLRDGTIIRGCITAEFDEKTGYPVVVVGDDLTCKGDPDKVSPYYAHEWAVVDKPMVKKDNVPALAEGEEGPQENPEKPSDSSQDWIFIGAFAWKSDDLKSLSNAPMDIVKSIYSGAKGADNVAPIYRNVACKTIDYPIDPKTDKRTGKAEEVGAITGAVKDGEKEDPVATKLMEDGCNNNNDVTPYDPAEGDKINSITCSVKYRIAGSSGIDIFSQYVRYLYRWAAGIVGIVAVFTIVFNGIKISVSGGGETTEAKERIMQSLVGIAILFLAGLILYTINPGFFTS